MPPRRWKLRNLDAPQKLLVAVVVGTVLGGYVAALLNVFAQHSEADGKATVHLEEFLDVYKREGLRSLIEKIPRRHSHSGWPPT